MNYFKIAKIKLKLVLICIKYINSTKMTKFNCMEFIICKTNNNQCCICRETHNKVGIQCIHCPAGTVCINCVPLLCESGMCKICPVCRQESWKNTMIKKTQIIPMKNSFGLTEISTETKCSRCEKLPPCKSIFDQLMCVGSALIISYLIGILTICSFISSNANNWNIGLHFLALLVGIIETVVISWCCYNSLCAPHLDY
jgi:hypothetical protein